MSKSSYDQAVNYINSGQAVREDYSSFEPGQMAKTIQGGVQINAQALISWGMKQPAYAAEAPLRPLNVASKYLPFGDREGPGGIATVEKGFETVVGKIPVLSDILGGLGNGLSWLAKVGDSIPNANTATQLAGSIGKSDSDRMGGTLGTTGMTVGEFRRQIMDMWSIDKDGNQYTLPQLEARARNNTLDFGQFVTSPDGLTSEVMSLIDNPINLLFTPAGGAALKVAGGGIRYAQGYARAASWARPIIKATTEVAPFRYGYGYARTMGRGIAKTYHAAHNPKPLDIEFLDVTSAARAVLDGGLREQGTMKSLLTAMTWGARGTQSLARKVYFPGLNTSQTGTRLVGDAARAWMRGGIQQELVGVGGDFLFGSIDNYLEENNMDHSVVGGITSALHDGLSEVMNDHPLSDSNAFVMISLLLPTSLAAREIAAVPGTKFRAARLPVYADNVVAHTRHTLNTKYGRDFKNNDEFLTALGKGDLARGKDIFEWWIDKMEVIKSKNQLSHLTHLAASAEVDGVASSAQFIHRTTETVLKRRRVTGALRPQSTSDYMFEQHFRPGEIPADRSAFDPITGESTMDVRTLASEVTGTAESFMSEMQNLYATYEKIGPQLRELGLDISKGGILDRETMEAIIAHVERTPEGLIDRNMAREIMDMGPSLVYEGDFWGEFAVTLGREQHGGIAGKRLMVGEGVTKDALLFRLGEIKNQLTSREELFHETLRASKAQGVANGSVVDGWTFGLREPPYPMAAKIKANRAKAFGRVTQLADNERALHGMRSNEFFKSGKPKFGSAAEIVGSEGGLFKRAETGSYTRADGVEISIDKGVINLSVLDPEALVLAAQHNGRIIVRDIADGETLAAYGFVESAKIRGEVPTAVEGMTRIYRGEGGRSASGTSGHWFSASKDVARDYGVKGKPLSYVDVPSGELATYRTGGPSADYGLGTAEYRVSDEIAASAKLFEVERAVYSYRGGDPAQIIANFEAGAFAPYRETKRVASERGAIGVARRDAIRSSMYVPSTHYLGKSAFSTKTMFPEERLRFIKEQQEATTKAYQQEIRDLSKIDEIALGMLPFDKKLTDMNLTEYLDRLSTAEYDKMRGFMEESLSDYPNLSLVPDAPGLIVDPAQSRFSTLVANRNRMQDLLIDYGPLSVVNRFYDAVFAGKHVRWLGKQNQTEVHNLLATMGVAPGASRSFMAKLHKEVLDSREVKGLASVTGSHMYGSIAALPEAKLRSIANEVMPQQLGAILERWGAVQKMFTEASNRLLRTVQQTTRVGGKVNKIEAAADAAFRIWQYAPGFEKGSFAGQRLTKFIYPFFRFYSDPLFIAMNYIEPTMYSVFNQGWRGLKPPSAGIERRSQLASAGSIPPGGLFDKAVPTELLLADPGFYTMATNIRPRFLRDFELTTNKKAELFYEAMTKEHPIAQLMRERFGDNYADWAAETNRVMESLVRRGPEQMVAAEWKATLEKEMGYTVEQLRTLAPVAERLTEVYRGIHSELANLYVGRMSRSNLERLANSYMVMWPISYMIKVTSWMYKVMFEKIGPVNGSVGSYAWDQYRQQYEKALEDQPDFKSWTEDNKDFLFAADMILPISPMSLGVSLGKTTRYVGSLFSPEIFGNYGVENPGDIVEGGMRVGPIRTFGLAQNILKGWQVPPFYQPKKVKYKPIQGY